MEKSIRPVMLAACLVWLMTLSAWAASPLTGQVDVTDVLITDGICELLPSERIVSLDYDEVLGTWSCNDLGEPEGRVRINVYLSLQVQNTIDKSPPALDGFENPPAPAGSVADRFIITGGDCKYEPQAKDIELKYLSSGDWTCKPYNNDPIDPEWISVKLELQDTAGQVDVTDVLITDGICELLPSERIVSLDYDEVLGTWSCNDLGEPEGRVRINVYLSLQVQNTIDNSPPALDGFENPPAPAGSVADRFIITGGDCKYEPQAKDIELKYLSSGDWTCAPYNNDPIDPEWISVKLELQGEP